MTTSVVIRNPVPNHLDLEVQLEDVRSDGTTFRVGSPRRLKEGGTITEHVHAGRRIVITEIAREG